MHALLVLLTAYILDVDILERYLVMCHFEASLKLDEPDLEYRNATPIIVTLVSFWHYAIVRQLPLTPSIAFTSVSFSFYNTGFADCPLLDHG